MPVDPQRLLILRAVRRAGGVTNAAQILRLTPSGISQHLAKLEAEIGVPVVDRTGRGGGRPLRLTAVGHTLADHADSISDTLSEVERDLARFRQSPAGSVHIGGFSVVLSQLVAPTVMRLGADIPAVRFQISEMAEEEGLSALTAGELDLLLVQRSTKAARPRKVREVDLLRDPYKVVVPASWPETTDATALLSRPWFTTTYDRASRDVLERMCAEHDIPLDARDIGRGTAPTLLAFVANGLGGAIVPELTLSQHPSSRIRTADGISDPGARTLSALYMAGNSPLLDQIVAELRRTASHRSQT